MAFPGVKIDPPSAAANSPLERRLAERNGVVRGSLSGKLNAPKNAFDSRLIPESSNRFRLFHFPRPNPMKNRLLQILISASFLLGLVPISTAQIRIETRYPDEGWLAADGVYSVREPEQGNVFFLFSDTICGTTQKNGQKFHDVFMVNHSFWKLSPEGKRECFIPDKGKNLLPDRFWLQDAIFLDGKLHFSAMIPNPGNWKPARMDWVTLSLLPNGTPDFQNPEIIPNVPLLVKTPDRDFVWGAAILEDADDGFLYVFGYLDQKKEFSRKDLIAARVNPKRLTDFSAWRFWNGQNWCEDKNQSCPLVKNISAEFSISRIPAGPQKGSFILVNTRGGISPIVEYRTADSPIGPFSEPKIICRAPEHKNGISAYNAKAHPALSTDEYLVFSYNLNRLGTLPRSPAEYRPQFWRIDYEFLGK